MITLVGRASCQVCGELAVGSPEQVDKAAERHTQQAGHATSVMVTPASR